MRRIGAFTLLTGMMTAVTAWSVDPPAVTEEIPWYRRVFLGERPKPVPQSPPKSTAPKPLSKEEVAKLVEEENGVYLKRLAAFSKLREVATERGDEQMLRRIDELERSADEVRRKRTDQLLAAPTLEEELAVLEGNRTPARGASAKAPRQPTRGGN